MKLKSFELVSIYWPDILTVHCNYENIDDIVEDNFYNACEFPLSVSFSSDVKKESGHKVNYTMKAAIFLSLSSKKKNVRYVYYAIVEYSKKWYIYKDKKMRLLIESDVTLYFSKQKDVLITIFYNKLIDTNNLISASSVINITRPVYCQEQFGTNCVIHAFNNALQYAFQ